jgi:hypothetical protein
MLGFFIHMLASMGGAFTPLASLPERGMHDRKEWTSNPGRTRQFERTHGRRSASQRSRGNRRKASR